MLCSRVVLVVLVLVYVLVLYRSCGLARLVRSVMRLLLWIWTFPSARLWHGRGKNIIYYIILYMEKGTPQCPSNVSGGGDLGRAFGKDGCLRTRGPCNNAGFLAINYLYAAKALQS